MPKLMEKYECEDVREWAHSERIGTQIGCTQVDDSERSVVATGRATCRQCGKKIVRGEKAVPFFVSFTDGSYNPWTSMRAFIHFDDCGKEV